MWKCQELSPLVTIMVLLITEDHPDMCGHNASWCCFHVIRIWQVIFIIFDCFLCACHFSLSCVLRWPGAVSGTFYLCDGVGTEVYRGELWDFIVFKALFYPEVPKDWWHRNFGFLLASPRLATKSGVIPPLHFQNFKIPRELSVLGRRTRFVGGEDDLVHLGVDAKIWALLAAASAVLRQERRFSPKMSLGMGGTARGAHILLVTSPQPSCSFLC